MKRIWIIAVKKAYLTCVIAAAWATHCSPHLTNKSLSSRDSTVTGSIRGELYPANKIMDIPFEVNYDKKSLDRKNLFWMSYFAGLQYSHFALVAQRLESLGFGQVGDGRRYQRMWYELRLAKIFSGVKDTDDSWTNEIERAEVLKKVSGEFKDNFPDADLSPKPIREAERQITGVHDDGRKILFISGKSYFDKSGESTGTSQLFYAEHRSLPLAILSFRGTEKGERLDAAADLLILRSKLRTQPGKVASGFLAAYAEIDSELGDLLKIRAGKNKDLNLMVTGHSLGGALATIFSARFMELQQKGAFKSIRLAGVYTLGSPRIGDEIFSVRYDSWFYSQQTPVFRIRNHKDLVTGVPVGLPGTSGFWHVGSLVYYDANGKIHYGDAQNGWEQIETKSDIKSSFPNSIKQHSVETYIELAKDALGSAEADKTQRCMSGCQDKTPMPYFEKSELRQKKIEELIAQYGVLF